MKKSNELRDFFLSAYKSMRDEDIGWWERHQSQREGALTIGTDPNEWWTGYAAIMDAVRPPMEAMAGSAMEGDP